MGYIGFFLGLNLSNTVNKSIQESSNEVYQEAKNENNQDVTNIVESDLHFNFIQGKDSNINCSNFELNAKAKATAKTILALTQHDNVKFDNDLITKLKRKITNEVKQKQESGLIPFSDYGDTNISNQINNTFTSKRDKISQIINNTLDVHFKQSTKSTNVVDITILGTVSGKNCKFSGESITKSSADIISEKLSDILLENSVLSEIDEEIKNKVDQTSGGLSLWMLALLIIPLVGGIGGASGGYIVAAILFLLCALGLAIALIFIDTRRCDNDDKDKPKLKETCEEKSSSEKDGTDCLECKDGSEIDKFPFSDWPWIICLASCIACMIISCVCFLMWNSKKTPMPDVEKGVIQGGRIVKSYLNKLFK